MPPLPPVNTADADKNKSAAATMAGCAGKVGTRICDVSDPASVKAAMAATLDAFGRVDGCFANAGIGGGGRHAFIDRTEEHGGPCSRPSRRCVPRIPGRRAAHDRARHLPATLRPAGATSSLASLFGTGAQRALRRDQGRHHALVRALAVELARQGVTANAILPGWIKSDMTAGIMANENLWPM